MNTATENAAHTAATLEAADPGKHLILVPLSQLLVRESSRRNVRKMPRLSIPELAASIRRVGLLQNLVVVLAPDGANYEVVAGGRRFAALKLLAKQHQISKHWEVPCLLVADASARTASLTENVQREAMHPADQFEAFAALVAEGRPIEDIAADFGVSPLVVQRRLRLANVSPRLMADYRTDAVTLEQLMALAISDDHAAQDAAFYDAPEWQRRPSALRARLTERGIDASQPLARFVGLDAYAAAGGGTRRDLFAEDDSGIYLDDAALLDRLASEKLAGLVDRIRAEGWAWVDVVPSLSDADRQSLHRAPMQRREPTAREARRMATLQARLDKTDAALDAACEAEDQSKVDTLESQRDQQEEALRVLRDGLQDYADDVRAVSGAIVSVGSDGEPMIYRGLLKDADAKALRKQSPAHTGTAEAGTVTDSGEPSHDPGLSDRLAQRLSAHRTAALQIEVARHPQVALAALVYTMVETVFQHGYGREMPLELRLTKQHRLEAVAPDWPESAAAIALRALEATWRERLPDEEDTLFRALLAMHQDELVRLLAFCVASTIDAVTPRASHPAPGAELAQAVGLDMAAWWSPTDEGYFRHAPKPVILAAVGQFAPADSARLSKLKKADLASEAGRLVKGTGWMPAIFAVGPETAGHTENESAAIDVEAHSNDAGAHCEAHAIAA